jgi:hypothetical protein
MYVATLTKVMAVGACLGLGALKSVHIFHKPRPQWFVRKWRHKRGTNPANGHNLFFSWICESFFKNIISYFSFTGLFVLLRFIPLDKNIYFITS